ncbi:NfeD family protein [Sphingomonas sp. ID0503]|uniref:NfeD family protein n=1 Tax=Sphingomonas sp. ID0503 TaxID=3399691 RepID=UPI003AFA31EF
MEQEGIDPQWVWLLAGACLACAELFLPRRFLGWVGLAALAVGGVILAIFVPVSVQFLLFAFFLALSLGTAIWLRRRNSVLPAPVAAPPPRVRRTVGRRALVVEAIVDGAGRVELDDRIWAARGPYMVQGAEARILAVEGDTMVVGPAGRSRRR